MRSLEAIAIDNAREGCVRECFGAALGCYQAQRVGDPAIAAAMAQIAHRTPMKFWVPQRGTPAEVSMRSARLSRMLRPVRA